MKRLNYFELDIPHCANTYGVSPCTAALTGDSKCFNTPATCQDREHLRPGYPLVDSVTETEFGSDTTGHTGLLPDGIATGDLLIAIWANDGSAAITTPTNWVKKTDVASGADVRTAVFVKKADGTEDATSTAGTTGALGEGDTGELIGDLTGGGGLVEAFDATTNSGATGDQAASTGATTSGYVGKSFTYARRVHSAVIYGANDTGFVQGINPTVTVVLRGKDGDAPTSRTDGTSIGSVSFTDTNNESAGRTITMTNQTSWEHVWADISHNGAANTIEVTELRLTEGFPFATFTTGSTEQGALQVFHVLKNNWTGNLDDVLVQSTAVGSSAAPDPAELAPGWGEVTSLWIAAAGASSVTTIDDYPDGFGNGLNSQGGTGATGASVSSAYVVAKAETIDPGPFDFAAAAPCISVGIAVRPFEEISLRFATPAAYNPKTIEAFPNITNIDHSPAVIGLGDNIGQRASISVTFEDAPHSDTGPGFDKYRTERTYNPFTRGTLWGKFRARQPFLIGSPCRLQRGLVGQSLDDMATYNFLVETTEGPTSDFRFTITGKDLLKMLDGDRAQAPAPNTGTCDAFPSGDSAIDLSPAGIGDAEYPSSGWVCVGGNEICSFTRVGDELTIPDRGEFNTDEVDHDAGERVQLVLIYSGEDVANIIADLIIGYAGVSPNYVPLSTWRTETAAFLNQVYSAVIPEPTSVRQLVSELIEQAGLSIWASDDPFLVNLQVLRSVASTAAVIDETVMRENTFNVAEQAEKRVSAVWTYYGQRNPTKPLDEEENYANLNIRISAQASLDYDVQAIRKVKSRWIANGGEATAERLGDILASRYNPAPRKFEFELFESGSPPVAPGIGYLISHPALQDETGDRAEIPIQVTSLKSLDDGVAVTAEEMTIGELSGLTGDVITINTSQNNVNLEVLHDLLYPIAVSGDNVYCYVGTGVSIGSDSTGSPAFEVGTFAAGVTIYIINKGRIQGAGGAGGDGGGVRDDGEDGRDGGLAFYTRRAINMDASLGALWGGGGGGGGAGGGGPSSGGTANTGGGGGGGGGAGRDTGNAGNGGHVSGNDGHDGDGASATSGGDGGDGGNGSGGQPDGGDGGDGGDPGQNGSGGQAGQGATGGDSSSGGDAGNATDGDSFITYGSWNATTAIFTPGALGTEDIRGGEVN